MSKLIFLECSAPHWIEVATNLKHQGHDVHYWTAWVHAEASIRSSFPDCVFHDTIDAKRGIEPSEYAFAEGEFDSVCQSVWMEEAQVVFDMMNRFDYARDMNNVDRSGLFLRLLVYWRKILDSGIDLLVFPAPPHVVYDYVALCLARRLGVKTIMFEEATIVPPYRIEMRDYVEGDLELRQGLGSVVDISEAAAEIVDRLRGDYEQAQPFREVEAQARMREARERGLEGVLEQVMSTFDDEQLRDGVTPRELKLINTTSLAKERGVSLSASFEGNFSNTRYTIQRYEECAHTEELFEAYEKLCTKPELIETPFVYLPLAGQPERTSNPQAGIFSNQLIMAKMIASSLPEGWSLVVKDHPNQFHPEFAVNMCRSEEFYEELTRHTNLFIVSTATNPFYLIDLCAAVATTGGTAALEAVARGKPALLFGDAWYRDCPGISRVRNLSDVKAFFARIPEVPRDGLGRFVQAVMSSCRRGMADYPPSNWPMDETENVANLTQSLLNGLKRR